MKKTTFYGELKVIQLLFLIVIFSSVNLFAENFVINESGTTKLKITENSYLNLHLTNSISELSFLNIKTEMGNFSELLIPGYAKTEIIGSPGLPVKRELIELPMDATPIVNILDYNIKEFSLTDLGITQQIIPAQPPQPKDGSYVEFQYDAEAYNQDKFYPEEIVTVDVLGMMRGLRIGRVNIAPVQYNPVTNTIRIIEDIDFKIVFENANIAKTKEYKKLNANIYFNAISKQLLNYKPLEGKELVTDAPAKYVIISDPMFESALQPFIEWKTKKGFVVIEAYTDDPNVGGTTTSIKNYLEDLYNAGTPEDPPPAFALIVGDVQQVPAYNGTTGGHVTDRDYYEYTGDWFPELYYGRFSAQNLGQLQPQIDKTLEYEQYTMPDPSFLDEVVMIAGMDSYHGYDWGNGQINYGTENYFNAAHGIISHTYLYPNSGSQAAQIIQDISNGVAYANYTAHCGSNGWSNPAFNTGHIPGLQNDHEYGLWVGNCCSSSAYNNGECFAEAALRAVDKGAVGYIGGSNGTMWDPDYYWGVGVGPITEDPPSYEETTLGAYDCTFHDHGEPIDDWYITQAQMFVAGNIAVELGTPGSAHYYWEIYCLMGDPSLMIYFSQPPDATANYQGLMPLGVATFTVNTDPYAYVAITKDGVLHGCAIADDTGLAEVTMFLPITEPGEADVVITGQNLKPYIGTVTVASPNSAYVLLDEIQIDDSNGNNNGLVDFSENILLDVTLENVGSLNATNLTATISSTNEYITIDNAISNWPDIAAGATSLQTGAFEFTVDDIVPDQHIVQFELEVTDGTDVWNSTFNLTLNSPVLTILSYSIDDSNGNNNGTLDPGETADIIVPNLNDGGCDALNTIASAVAAGSLITINNATYDLETIASGETKNAVFNVTVDASAQIGDIVYINYLVESDPYSANEILTLNIGLIVEDFESGGFNSYEWEFSGNAEWIIDDVNPYEGVYCAKSGDIDDNETSVLLINVDVAADDQISFFRKVSSESNYDYLKFYIDGSLQEQWSGEVAWGQVTYPVTAGTHIFKWIYSKDLYVSNGDDCAWIDYIVFPAFAGSTALSVNASANPTNICEGENSQLNAFAMGGTGNYTYEWTPEDGLNDPTIANPVATPDETTTYYVIVNDGDDIVTDEVTVTVHPIPETPVVTQQGTMLISSAAFGNQWYNSNGIIPGATNQSYTPTVTDDYYVIVTSVFGCQSEQSNIYHFI
ncbi:MAG: hypothetical protein IMY70_01330, partial [Bacteroidetes bacterium]|nr:hypothetical protein [Bacteroidota bacterium]